MEREILIEYTVKVQRYQSKLTLSFSFKDGGTSHDKFKYTMEDANGNTLKDYSNRPINGTIQFNGKTAELIILLRKGTKGTFQLKGVSNGKIYINGGTDGSGDNGGGGENPDPGGGENPDPGGNKIIWPKREFYIERQSDGTYLGKFKISKKPGGTYLTLEHITVFNMSNHATVCDRRFDPPKEISTTSMTYDLKAFSSDVYQYVPGVTYVLRYSCRDKNNNYMEEPASIKEAIEYTIEGLPAPLNWDAIEYLLKPGKKCHAFPRATWNSLVNKICQINEYFGRKWNNRYGTPEETKMSGLHDIEGKLTAKRYNAVRVNIEGEILNEQLLEDSNSCFAIADQTPVKGQYIIDLKNGINADLEKLSKGKSYK